MTKKEILEWFYNNTQFINNSGLLGPSDNTKITFTSEGVDIDNDIQLNKDVTEIPFKIHIVNGWVSARWVKITSLENFPDVVAKDLYLSDTSLTSLKYLPKTIGDELYLNGITIDPYEYRYIFYSTITNGVKSTDKEVSDIIKKYWEKPQYFHLAIQDLMNLGESRGFTYD